METIVLTEVQAGSLLAANGNSQRILEPRRLADGRLILNADILDDPFFVDRGRGWAQVLLAEENLNQQAQTQHRDVIAEVGVRVETSAISTPIVLAAGIQRVILTETELV